MSNTINTNALLLQLRAMAEDAGLPPSEAADTAASKTEFSEIMQSSIREVADRQRTAKELAESFDMGNPEVELVDVMLAVQKARVSFEALTQVRNKMVAAYQDIMNMPI